MSVEAAAESPLLTQAAAVVGGPAGNARHPADGNLLTFGQLQAGRRVAITAAAGATSAREIRVVAATGPVELNGLGAWAAPA